MQDLLPLSRIAGFADKQFNGALVADSHAGGAVLSHHIQAVALTQKILAFTAYLSRFDCRGWSSILVRCCLVAP